MRLMHGHGVCDFSCVWHQLEDPSHCKGLQHFSTLLLMHLKDCPTADLSERGCMPCGGRQSVYHMMGRPMTNCYYAVHAFSARGPQHCGDQIVQKSSRPVSLVCLIVHAHATDKQEDARIGIKIATLNRCTV